MLRPKANAANRILLVVIPADRLTPRLHLWLVEPDTRKSATTPLNTALDVSKRQCPNVQWAGHLPFCGVLHALTSDPRLVPRANAALGWWNSHFTERR